MPDIELLYRTLAYIEANLDQWDQRWWFTAAAEREDPSCGTSHCFGGWALALSGVPMRNGGEYVHVDDLPPSVAEQIDPALARLETALMRQKDRAGDEPAAVVWTGYAAQTLLGLDWAQAEALFASGNDLLDLRRIVAEVADSVRA